MTETRLSAEPPLVGREDWVERFPWLVHGVTTRERDMALFGTDGAKEVLGRWEGLRDALGFDAVVHARQVHGVAIRMARPGPTGLVVAPPGDGHLTRDPRVLLTVAVADCVPIFLVAPELRALGLLHGGWRGVAAGILEAGIRAMGERFGVGPGDLELHLGPSIAGGRYEVGPEVFRALGAPDPGEPRPLDLRAHLVERALRCGVPAERVGVSALCVYEDERFFSHRGGDTGRQLAVLGYRGRPGGRR